MTDLIIAEKYNAAEQISNVLSEGSARIESVSDTPVFAWGRTRCVGLAGHIVAVDFPDEYNGDWGDVDLASLIEADIVHQPSKKNLVKAVRQLVTDADRIIIATDFDREGELIGVEALNIATQAAGDDITIKRARFSSLAASEIQSAFADLESVDNDLAAAGETRQRVDLRWGALLTRFLTLHSGANGELLSAGRVQTPTLKQVLDRERAIESFEPEPYWVLSVTLGGSPASDHIVPFDGDRISAVYYRDDSDGQETTRIWDADRASQAVTALQETDTLIVTDASADRKRDYPPDPFDTTAFITEATSCGFGAKQAMGIAESLYDEGYISYPRTDNTVYPDSTPFDAILDAVQEVGDSDLTGDAQTVQTGGEYSPTAGDTESTDHPPIRPTESAPTRRELSSDEWEIYELVTRRFLATLSDPAVWTQRRIDFAVSDADTHQFKSTGRTLETDGYYAVYPYQSPSETPLPEPPAGAAYSIHDIDREEKETEPPNRYGQSGLINRMEDLSLGTKSTRHNHIDTLYDRDYLTKSPLRPTPLARTVIEALEENATRITEPEMTAELEQAMDAIAAGDASLDAVTAESQDLLATVYDQLRQASDEIETQLSDALAQQDDPTEVGTCPDCGSQLVVRETGDGGQFIGCDAYPECEYTLSIPDRGRVHVLDEYCEEHELPHIKLLAGKYTQTVGCPACQSEAAAETADRELGDCPDCDSGAIAIKRVSSGARLIGCSEFPECEFSAPLPREGEIELGDERCETHNIPVITVIHDDYDGPWELGCPACS